MEKNKTLSFGFDIDGVIADFTTAFFKFYNSMYPNSHADQTKVTRWDYSECPECGVTEDGFREAFEQFNRMRMWQKVKLIKNADNVLCALSVHHNIYYITSRPKESERATLKFILKNGLPINGIIFCKFDEKPKFAKTLKIDIAIEDKPDIIKLYIDNGVKVAAMMTSDNKEELKEMNLDKEKNVFVIRELKQLLPHLVCYT